MTVVGGGGEEIRVYTFRAVQGGVKIYRFFSCFFLGGIRNVRGHVK